MLAVGGGTHAPYSRKTLAVRSLSHELEHLAERIDVGAGVALGSGQQLFWRHIADCSSRNLEHAEGLAV